MPQAEEARWPGALANRADAIQGQGREVRSDIPYLQAVGRRRFPRPHLCHRGRKDAWADAPRRIRSPRLRKLLAARLGADDGGRGALRRVHVQDFPAARQSDERKERCGDCRLCVRTRLGIRKRLRAVPEARDARLARTVRLCDAYGEPLGRRCCKGDV